MNDFNDLLGGMFARPGFDETDLGRAAAARRDAAKPNPDAPLPQIRGRQIDDTLYVRAEDVADALERLSPTGARRLINKLRGAL